MHIQSNEYTSDSKTSEKIENQNSRRCCNILLKGNHSNSLGSWVRIVCDIAFPYLLIAHQFSLKCANIPFYGRCMCLTVFTSYSA